MIFSQTADVKYDLASCQILQSFKYLQVSITPVLLIDQLQDITNQNSYISMFIAPRLRSLSTQMDINKPREHEKYANALMKALHFLIVNCFLSYLSNSPSSFSFYSFALYFSTPRNRQFQEQKKTGQQKKEQK